MNHIMIAGRLGSDPEVRFTSSGQKVTTFRMATNSKRGGKEETTWWRITLWGEQFDKMLTYIKKGSAIIVYGDLAKPEIYQDREGNSQISLNVTASSLNFSPFGKSDGESSGGGQKAFASQAAAPAQNQGYEQPAYGQGQPAATPAFSDEEIPF